MAKLKATKTSMYQLIRKYISETPPIRKTVFSKYRRSYFLDYRTGGNYHHVFLSVAGGRVFILHNTNRYEGNKQVEQYHPDLEELRELGMLEELASKH